MSEEAPKRRSGRIGIAAGPLDDRPGRRGGCQGAPPLHPASTPTAASAPADPDADPTAALLLRIDPDRRTPLLGSAA